MLLQVSSCRRSVRLGLRRIRIACTLDAGRRYVPLGAGSAPAVPPKLVRR